VIWCAWRPFAAQFREIRVSAAQARAVREASKGRNKWAAIGPSLYRQNPDCCGEVASSGEPKQRALVGPAEWQIEVLYRPGSERCGLTPLNDGADDVGRKAGDRGQFA
jgi:hypothetical protein